MGKPLLQISYSSDYDGGRAIQSYKSPIKVTIRWDGQITLRSLFKELLGGMCKPLLEVSYSRD